MQHDLDSHINAKFKQIMDESDLSQSRLRLVPSLRTGDLLMGYIRSESYTDHASNITRKVATYAFMILKCYGKSPRDIAIRSIDEEAPPPSNPTFRTVVGTPEVTKERNLFLVTGTSFELGTTVLVDGVVAAFNCPAGDPHGGQRKQMTKFIVYREHD